MASLRSGSRRSSQSTSTCARPRFASGWTSTARSTKTAAYGHFGRDDEDFTWERTELAAELRAAAGLAAFEVVA